MNEITIVSGHRNHWINNMYNLENVKIIYIDFWFWKKKIGLTRLFLLFPLLSTVKNSGHYI